MTDAGPSSISPTDLAVCPHLAEVLNGPEYYKVLRRYSTVVRSAAVLQRAKRRKIAPATCDTCSAPLTRPWTCLTCPFVGCLPAFSRRAGSSKDCLGDHWLSSPDCHFGIDPSTGSVWCSECSDIHHLSLFERAFEKAQLEVEEENDMSQEASALGPGRGRKRGHYHQSEHPPDPSGRVVPCSGLRPLLNLSQTCFLSAILQAFLHNPLLKAYFLSDKHNRLMCPNSRGLGAGRPFLGLTAESGQVGQDREKGCMCCEMDRAFEEFHGGDKSPFGPITMLYAMWHASAELEGYGQQDAHSFFLAALDQIHAHAKGQLSGCNCIAHQTFAGSLLSTVKCSSCHTTSTTIDPILDIQLDFPPNAAPTETLSLTGMLRRFCAEERVGEMGKGYDCSSCGGAKGLGATRKLLIKKLPPVLSFQLKRFGHHNALATKVESAVRFPSVLDMRPYTESHHDSHLPDSLFLYDLFAVVTHEGKLDNGHYWADVLSGDEWWHCDDDKVTPTTLAAVQGQKGYMLFYCKRTLAYAEPLSKTQTTSVPGSDRSPSKVSAKTAAKGLPTASPTKPHVPGPDSPEEVLRSGKSGHPIRGMEV